MRIALISDIHGNLVALEAVLEDIQKQRVDSLVCLGDVATLGPQPLPVIAKLLALGCPCVMGNHDAALFDADNATRFQIASSLVPTVQWAAAQLTPQDFAFLRSFKPTVEIALAPDTNLLCFHGSPHSNTDMILATTPTEELDRLLEPCTAQVFAGGHTHVQMLRQHKGKLVINAGSVGSPFRQSFVPNTQPELLPWAEYTIIESHDGNVSVNLHRVRFDLDAFCRIASEGSLPLRDWWVEQYRRAG
jgi:putative phosphoesterase